MTVRDLLKRLTIDDLDKCIIFVDVDGGWTDFDLLPTEGSVAVNLVPSSNSPFSDDK